jgi:hypothetical protein
MRLIAGLIIVCGLCVATPALARGHWSGGYGRGWGGPRVTYRGGGYWGRPYYRPYYAPRVVYRPPVYPILPPAPPLPPPPFNPYW